MVNSAFTQMPTTFSTGHLLICEGESGQLRCNKEGKINVLSANYGRLDSHSCPHWMTTDTNCRSGNSFAQTQQICQRNSTCELEATNVFFGGDPCMGTYKYLFVEYQLIVMRIWCQIEKTTSTSVISLSILIISFLNKVWILQREVTC